MATPRAPVAQTPEVLNRAPSERALRGPLGPFGAALSLDPGIDATGDALTFPATNAWAVIDCALDPGVHRCVIAFAEPVAVRLALDFPAGPVALPVAPAAARLAVRFRTTRPVRSVRLMPVEAGTVRIASFAIERTRPWRAVMPDVVIGPLVLPPRRSLMVSDEGDGAGRAERCAARRPPSWSPGLSVAAADAVAVDGDDLTVAEANGALRLALDPPLSPGWHAIQASIRTPNGDPRSVKPRLFPADGWQLPDEPGARLFADGSGRASGLLRVRGPLDTLILRPREQAGTVRIEGLCVRRVPPWRAWRTGLRVHRARRALVPLDFVRPRLRLAVRRLARRLLPATLRHVFSVRSRAYRCFLARHEADAVRRFLAGPVLRDDAMSVAVVGSCARGRAVTLRSLRAGVDPGWRLVDDATEAEVVLPAGTRLAPFAIAALRRLTPGPVVADSDVSSLGLRHSPQLLAGFDRRRAAAEGTVRGLLAVPPGEGSRYRRAMTAPRVAHVPLTLTHSPRGKADAWAALNAAEASDPPISEPVAATSALAPTSATGAIAATLATAASAAPARPERPLVSIITATRNAPEHLARYLATLHDTSYAPFEVVLVDNGSDDERALCLLREAAGRVRVIRDDRPFNFAALNNLGAAAARGDVLVFANNDIRFVAPDWLAALVDELRAPDVGVAGARLLYPDGRVQHAGKCLAGEVGVRHLERFLDAADPGYLGRQRVATTVSCVTGALMAVRREVFAALGGFDAARFPVLYNDTDLCLRALAAGHRVVHTPRALAIHHESASLGSRQRGDLTVAKGPSVRHAAWCEAEAFQSRWRALLDRDPHYPGACDPAGALFRPRG